MRELILSVFIIMVFCTIAQSATLLKDTFVIGSFVTHTPGDIPATYYSNGPVDIDMRFGQVAEANFNLIMIAPGCTKFHMDLAQKHGLKAMIEDSRMNDMARDFVGEPSQDLIEKNLKAIIADWSTHPALWGYSIIDEPNTSKNKRITAIMNYLKENDPKHVGFINMLPNYASKEQLGSPDYVSYLENYLSTVKPSHLAFDHYTIRADGTMGSGYFQNLESCRDAAVAHNLPLITTIASMRFDIFADPDEAQLRWQIYTSIVYGAKGMMYFEFFVPTFASPDFQDGLVDRNGNLTKKYYYSQKINAEVMALSPVLMRLKSTSVYHTGTIPDGAKKLPSSGNLFIKSVENGEFVVGFFKHKNGNVYAMIVNRDYKNSAQARVTFNGKVKVNTVGRKSGKETKLAVELQGANTTCNIDLAAGDAILLRLAKQ